MKAPEAYPLGYVEDAFEVRTKLADFFNILRQIMGGISCEGKPGSLSE